MSSVVKQNLSATELRQQVKELQQQLADSEDRLRSFLSQSHQAFCCLEFDPPVPTHLPAKDQAAMMLSAHVAGCNIAFAHLYGANDPAEVTGSRFFTLAGTASETLMERALRFVRSGYCINEATNSETLHDGTVRHFNTSSRGEIHDGHVHRVWITGRDVTFQTLIESASKQGDVELRRTAEQLDSGFWLIDWHRFEVLFVGPEIEQRWGISQTDLQENPLCWLQRVHEHDRQRVRDAFLTHAATGGFDESFRMYLPDGSVGRVRDRGFPLPETTGNELRVVGLVQDVSDSHRAQTGFNSLFRVSTEMLFVMDTLGALREVNPALSRTLGYEADELTALSLFDVLPTEEQSNGRQLLSQLASGKAVVEVQTRFLKKDGSDCPVEVNAAPASDDQLIYAAARDISSELADRKRRLRQNTAASRVERLSPRELQIADLIVAGKANKVIAQELNLSKRTVETHRANLMKKLEMSTTAELVHLMLQAAD